jgi:hypothetical protein
MNCWHCGRAIEVIERVGFRDTCPGCDRAAHACRNCRFYDPAYNNSCRETMASRVVDKERFNFCEYFAAVDSRPGGTQPHAPVPKHALSGAEGSDAMGKLKALFEKK